VESFAQLVRSGFGQAAFRPRSAIDMLNQAISNSAAETVYGMAVTNLAAPAARALATTNFETMLPSNRQTIATAAGMTEKRASHTCCSRRAVGGGFRFETIFGIAAADAGVKAFFGLSSANAAMTNVNPSTLLNLIGFGKDQADANFSLMSNDGAGAAAKTALTNAGGRAAAIDSVFKVELWCDAGEAGIDYQVSRISSTGVLAQDFGQIAADLPVIDTLFVPHLWMGNSSAVAHTWDFSSLALSPAMFSA
jgi:hypothetical protein